MNISGVLASSVVDREFESNQRLKLVFVASPLSTKSKDYKNPTKILVLMYIPIASSCVYISVVNVRWWVAIVILFTSFKCVLAYCLPTYKYIYIFNILST
jgi:hypothetical protein